MVRLARFVWECLGEGTKAEQEEKEANTLRTHWSRFQSCSRVQRCTASRSSRCAFRVSGLGVCSRSEVLLTGWPSGCCGPCLKPLCSAKQWGKRQDLSLAAVWGKRKAKLANRLSRLTMRDDLQPPQAGGAVLLLGVGNSTEFETGGEDTISFWKKECEYNLNVAFFCFSLVKVPYFDCLMVKGKKYLNI